jgi:hypothetical protein
MSQWAEFLRKLNPGGDRQLEALWRMSDGSTHRRSVPAAELVEEDELAAELQFPYKLYETNELEFPATGPDGETVDLGAIEQAARTSGLIYRRKPDRIIVRSPYTC